MIKTDQYIGKLPPQAIEVEEVVLGTVILVSGAYAEIADSLTADMFYRDDHVQIYSAVANLFNTHKPIDPITVTQELRRLGKLDQIGGAYAITMLTDRVASKQNLEYHARIIQQNFIAREVIRLTSEASIKAYDETEDVLKLIDSTQSGLYALVSGMMGRKYARVSDMITGRLKAFETGPAKNGITGIASGLKELDELTCGWQNSDLIIVAARPSMGKTAFMLHCARESAIRQGKNVGIFSLEMSKEKLVDRMIAGEAGVSMTDIKKHTMQETDWLNIHQTIRGLEESGIFIDDSPALTHTQIRAKSLRMKQENDIELLIIDYLGLIRTAKENRNSNRTNDVGEVSRALKAIAKELDIPVICLSQLSRKVEDRPGTQKMPRLSDLRDSGEIEQDADVVIFLYRPEYYGIDHDDNNEPTLNMCKLLVEKNRDGELGTPVTEFVPALMRFSNWNTINSSGLGNNFVPYDTRPSNFIIKPSTNFDNDYTPF